jgi:trk system potassium uptake protein TrkH
MFPFLSGSYDITMMSTRSLARSIGAICTGIAIILLVPALVAVLYGEPWLPFGGPLGAMGLLAIAGYLIGRDQSAHFGPRDGVLVVVLAWVLACVVGAVPFLISGVTSSIADAVFESTSGFTTTGSSIFRDVESLPKSILLWRSLTHWLGGMGIIVLAVAVLPALGVGGFQMLRAEAPGPDVERLAPRIADTARAFWAIYAAITALEVLLLLIGGMSLFDAINHSFATLATGGFSTRNGSIASYESPYIEWVVALFMVLSGVNFALYYRALTGRFDRIRRDSEFKVYVAFFLVAAVMVSASLLVSGSYEPFGDSLRYGTFQVATLMTSTGFATADYTLWPGLARGILLVMLLIGGCVGSTSGGIKMLHVTVVGKIIGRQLRRLAHPRAVVTIQLNRAPLSLETENSVVGFVTLYITVVLVSTIIVASSGADLETALTASLAAIGNVGPGFGQVGPALNFAFLPDYAKIALSVVMLVGRLEIYTALLLFVPGYLRGW